MTDPIDEGLILLGGLNLAQWRVTSFKGLEDLAELEDENTDIAGDGHYLGEQRMVSREITVGIQVREQATEETPEVAAATTAAMKEIRKVLARLPNSGTRLLQWHHPGDIAKRISVRPGPKPLEVNADKNRFAFNNPDLIVRLDAPDPIVLSDELHEHTFTAGETFPVVNDGDLCAVNPSAWNLSAPGGVTIENLDQPGQLLTFPTGPVTVSRTREVIAPGAYASCFGTGGTWLPQWVLLPPGTSHIRASAPCTFQWRDTFA